MSKLVIFTPKLLKNIFEISCIFTSAKNHTSNVDFKFKASLHIWVYLGYIIPLIMYLDIFQQRI